MRKNLDHILLWEPRDILFNRVHPESTNVVNLLVPTTKFFIFQQKCLVNNIKSEMCFLYYSEYDRALSNLCVPRNNW